VKTLVFLVLAGALATPLFSGQRSQKAPVPPYLSEAEAKKPLPPTQSPSNFTDPQAVRAYKIAKEIPMVLAQQPCYCWCSRGGHRSLHDCYVDTHGEHCDICQKEAFLADKMHKQGKSAADIRAAIERGDWTNVE
jgi:hypothetical protein